MKTSRSDFPGDFLFGVATSSYQIEGHSFGGAGRTHWDDFAATPGNVARAENGAVACDHFHRMDEDLDLIRDLGTDVYRFSTSWARVLPEGRGHGEPGGAGFLRPPRRRPAGPRHQARRHALPLGTALAFG